ncbi:MAG: hypothetical protein ACJ746_17325 [Bryobacteraceae bacterium]
MAQAKESRAPESNADFELPVQLLATDGSRESIPAEIRRVNNGFFQLRTTAALDIGRRFSLDFDACRTELEVIYCQRPFTGTYHVGARIIFEGASSARKEIRLPVDIRATVSVPGVFEGARGVVKGISASGLRVMVPAAVEAGSMIALDIGNGVVFGEVKLCRELPDGRHQTDVSLNEFLERPEHQNSDAADSESAPAKGLFRRLLSRRD